MTIAALAPFRSAPVRRPIDDDFSRLYRQYRPQLFRYITHHFGPRDADEITQEALTRALRLMDTDRTEAETWAWLVRVARNVAHDMARARRLCESTDDDTLLANDVLDDTALPEPAALLNERRRLVRTALKELPPSQRRILVLYEVDELNCPAIARLVGSTEDAVRKALQRARRRFAAEVRALGGGAAGSFAFWLRGFRRKSLKVMPAASSTALCALVGTVALTVTVRPVAPLELSPRLAPPVASSVPEHDLGPAGGAVRKAPAATSHAGTRTATNDIELMPGDGTKGLIQLPTTPFSPEAGPTRTRVIVYVPFHGQQEINNAYTPSEADPVACELDMVFECG